MKNLYVEKAQKIERLIKAVDGLQAIPTVTAKVLRQLDDSQSTAKKIADTASFDPILTARMLRIANSVFYGLSGKIMTLKHAIVVLGFDTIKGLVLAASVQKIFKNDMTGYKIEGGELWRHSVGNALCSQIIAAETRQNADEAFVAGILHDIGKVVLDRLVTSEYEEIMMQVIEENLSFIQAEKNVLGFDHAEIGAKVAVKWRLPDSLAEAIEYHHNPFKSKKSKKMASIIRISDATCLMYGIGIGGEELGEEEKEKLAANLEIDDNRLLQLMEKAGENALNFSFDFTD